MKKPKHYRERNRIMINYFKMPVGYLIAWDRQHNTTKVSQYGDRKQPPAKKYTRGSTQQWEWALYVAHETCTQTQQF